MRIAVLSGKGGTGKTFVAVNLACASGKSTYADCDVEEPNGRLFLKPLTRRADNVNVMVPAVDTERCTGCRKCVDFCKFNALAYIRNRLMIFSELCHACGGCVMLCPVKALSETDRNIGHIEQGVSQGVEVITGVLNTGEATGVPVIRQLLSRLPQNGTVIIDCPPGSACSVMESIRDADFCLMVAEPTRFGIHNLDMVYKLVKLYKKPHALVVNKDMGDIGPLRKYCGDNGINIIASIPYDAGLGLANSKGLVVSAEYPHYLELFRKMLEAVEKEARHEATGHTER